MAAKKKTFEESMQRLEEIVSGAGLGQQARRLQAHQEAPLLV